MKYNVRGFSPIGSSLLMLLVAIGVLATIYTITYTQGTSRLELIKQKAVEARELLEKRIAILLAVINATDNTLRLVISTGKTSPKLITVYINETYIGQDFNIYLPPLKTIPLILNIANPNINLTIGGIAYVKVVYDGGVTGAWAEIVS